MDFARVMIIGDWCFFSILSFSQHRKVKNPKSSVNPEHLVMLMMLLTSSAEYGAVASQAQRINSSDCWL